MNHNDFANDAAGFFGSMFKKFWWVAVLWLMAIIGFIGGCVWLFMWAVEKFAG